MREMGGIEMLRRRKGYKKGCEIAIVRLITQLKDRRKAYVVIGVQETSTTLRVRRGRARMHLLSILDINQSGATNHDRLVGLMRETCINLAQSACLHI